MKRKRIAHLSKKGARPSTVAKKSVWRGSQRCREPHIILRKDTANL